jgi:hypothetical protein
MNNPFTPPGAEVADVGDKPRASWLRTVLLVIGFGAASLFVAWFIVPLLVAIALMPLGVRIDGTPPPLFLLLDLALSFGVSIAACYFAAALSRGHAIFAAWSVAVIGWGVYFIEVGGLDGMFSSPFPFWYDMFPSDILAAFIAVWLVKRHEVRPSGR